ncbi:amino acid/amide ABC transporter substrate-binding protein, HAAT family [Faunimonas pinastri]|uniref:Amino acid/amide ABC transporter substrate-binding protein, HAAT family n=1 Tax=Faunimonas pinastri TaxID=1855383 RepID=A0A1H9EDS9_9HYPH|nr:ABC transporter substrate-binding protein [Faunimonas pinastri]SEQ23799.1 amino acid/amide ABC transporter substrate-binding protein, HAAT family [Faunimonas pinastri]
MNKGRSYHVQRAYITLAAFGLIAFANAGSASAADLVVGELHPITGQASYYGLPMSKGIQLAIQQVNAAGGLKVGNETYQLKLSTGDDQATGVAGVAALRKLIANGVHFIIGPQSSPVASAVSPIMKSHPDVLQIIDGSTANGIVNGRNTFRTTVTAGTYDDAVVKIAGMKTYKSVALLTNRLAAGFMETEGEIVKKLESAGHKVVDRSYFKVGDTDFSAQLTRVLSLNPDALYLRDAPVEDALITKQAKLLGYKGDIVWEVNAPATTVVKNIDDADMNGVLNGIPPKFDFYMKEGGPAAKALEGAYKQAYGSEPGENTGISYDSANILFTAMQKAGSVEPRAVAEALKNVKVADVPKLVTRFEPHEDGLLFKDGQAHLPTLAQVWKDGDWRPIGQ